jgi:Protein of unknown function (DUF4012)
VAEPVLLISSDPFLGASLEAVALGRLEIARLDPAHRPPAWPAPSSATVVLDVTARQRESMRTWIRRHHPGPLVILLKPGERPTTVPPDPTTVVVGRPFRLIELVTLLEQAPGPPPPDARDPEVVEGEQEEEGEDGEGSQGGQGSEEGDEGERHPQPAEAGPPLGRVADRWESGGRLSTPPSPPSPPSAPSTPPSPPTPPSAPSSRPSAPSSRPSAPSSRPSAPSGAADSARHSPRRLPRPDWPTAATRLAGRRRRPGWRTRRVATRVLVGVLVGLVVLGGWLTLGLLQARQDLLVGAAGVRDELARAEAAVLQGRADQAEAAVQAAERSLAVAAAVPDRREMQVAARLPVLSGGIADTRRLLAAAAGLTGAGERAVAVAPRLRAGSGALLRGDRFDLDALDDATAQAKGLVAELEAARAQLQEVRGGPLEPGVDETRRWALGRLDDALARARPLVATFDALPAGLGVDGARRYLAVLTSPAEPLAVREVVLKDGVVDLRPGDGELAEALRDTGTSADFPATGRAWLRAAEGLGRGRPDGVITLDPVAMRMLLEATGPVAVPGYGRLDAAGAEAQLTRGADRRYHEAVLATLVARFLTGNDLVATGRVLGAAGAGRNVQVYAADPGLQRMLASHRLDGTGPPRR